MRKLFALLLFFFLSLAWHPHKAHAYVAPVNCSGDGGHAEVYATATNLWSCVAVTGGGSSSITIGTTTITSGTTTRVLFDNGGLAGEYSISGTGNVAMTTNGVFTTPNLGTPSAITLTNGTGLPLSGLTGFGTGVATALGVNVGSAGAFLVNGGVLGTPSSGTATNLTGLPLSTGITGFGTGVITALAINTGSAGSIITLAGAAGTPSSINLSNATNLPTSAMPANQIVGGWSFVIDGGGSTISTGVKGFVVVPYACTLTDMWMLGDQSGSIVVDIWKKAFTTTLPAVGNTITASALPTISSAITVHDATLTGWTTAVAAGDMVGYNVNSITTMQRVTVTLKCNKT